MSCRPCRTPARSWASFRRGRQRGPGPLGRTPSRQTLARTAASAMSTPVTPQSVSPKALRYPDRRTEGGRPARPKRPSGRARYGLRVVHLELVAVVVDDYEMTASGINVRSNRPQLARGAAGRPGLLGRCSTTAPSTSQDSAHDAATEPIQELGVALGRAAHRAGPAQCVADDYDFIILDTWANLSHLTLGALVAARHIVIPVSATVWSTTGPRKFVRWIDGHRDDEVVSARLLGLAAAMVDSRTGLAEACLRTFRPARSRPSRRSSPSASGQRSWLRTADGNPGPGATGTMARTDRWGRLERGPRASTCRRCRHEPPKDILPSGWRRRCPRPETRPAIGAFVAARGPHGGWVERQVLGAAGMG